MTEYHIAQINVARMLAPIDDPIMADFVAQLTPIVDARGAMSRRHAAGELQDDGRSHEQAHAEAKDGEHVAHALPQRGQHLVLEPRIGLEPGDVARAGMG